MEKILVQLIIVFIFFLFKKILFVYLRQRRREGERGGEKHQCVAAFHAPPTGDLTWSTPQAWALTRNQTGNPLVCRLVLTELHQPGLFSFSLFIIICFMITLWSSFCLLFVFLCCKWI